LRNATLAFLKQVLEAHDRILEAVQAGDAGLARMEMLRHVREVEDGLESIRVSQSTDVQEFSIV